MAAAAKSKTNVLDRVALALAPKWGLSRIRARAIAETIKRHYEAVQPGRRTEHWPRYATDANAANGPALSTLRNLARDLVRNDGWAKKGVRVIANNTVGWGLHPKPIGGTLSDRFRAAWKAWAGTTQCDADARLTFYGLQKLALKTITESGELLVRRRRRLPKDGLPIPLQLQLLEPDFLDTSKDGMKGIAGGPIVQGVEFDAIGRRAAYWLFDVHPGSNRIKTFLSKRVPASEILHVFELARPGQVRGVSWFGPVLLKVKDFDEYDDATLMRQKIAACFAAFVTDVDGSGLALGEQSTTDELVETLEPGMVSYLAPGKTVSFATPPSVSDHDSYSGTTLHAISAGLGTTYEDMTGDYRQVNFSSSRLARISHWDDVHDWRWNMLVPQFCDPVWAWMVEAAMLDDLIDAGAEAPTALWTPPPMAMLEPDREGLALQRLVRTGAMTPDEMVRQQGEDPEEHWAEYAANLSRLDELGIWLDSDPRRVSQAGLTQARVGAAGGNSGGDGSPEPPP